MKNCTTGIKALFCAGRSRWGRSLMDFFVSLVGRTFLKGRIVELSLLDERTVIKF